MTEECAGCGICKRLCPVFAISGGKDARHSINEARCVECGVCGRACPKGAIRDEAGAICAQVKRPKWPKPKIDKELCSACSICVNDCSPNALRISLPGFRGDIHVYAEFIEPQKCVGCGICVEHCPLKAITMEAPQ
ncbi:MAG: 4Fe-4S binding protein [Treponema sp.]|nr:4Fe-4S binding protein [Treponema sp.]